MKTEIPMPLDLRDVVLSLPTDRAYLVGGCVRDHFLGLEPKDFDIEVYGMDYDALSEELKKSGKVDVVGKAFAVIKSTLASGETHDFSLPRRDNKVGAGHRDFAIETGGFITEEEGATRRDLTINAISWNPKTGEIFDPFNGLQDLEKKILRHTSPQFSEDPLRPLRVFQFAARFEFDIAPETAAICRSIRDSFCSLPQERIREEFEKFLVKGKNHNKGFQALVETGWLSNFPEIEKLHKLPQDVEYHPEGDVLTHTGHCLTALASLPAWQSLPPREKTIVMLGVLSHDLGKATTTTVAFKQKMGRDVVVSPGHDLAGASPTKSLLARIGFAGLTKEVLPLVTHHMDHLQIKNDSGVRNLAVQVEPSSIEILSLVTEADHSGRPPLEKKQADAMQTIIDRSKVLGCYKSKQANFLTGGYIIEESNGVLSQGPVIGLLLKAAYQAQIKGAFTDPDSAKDWYLEHRGTILDNAKMGPPRIISGDELVAARMVKGKQLGMLHRTLYNLQLNGAIKTHFDALGFISQHADKYGVTSDILAGLKASVPTLPGRAVQAEHSSSVNPKQIKI